MIEINNLSLQHKKTRILNEISVTFQDGEIVGIKGENGSGKSVLLKTLCGLIMPTHGSISQNGNRIGPDANLLSKCGVLIDKPGLLPDLSGYENLVYYSRVFKKKTSKADIEKGLTDFGFDIEDNRPTRKYSMGMKQKIGILQAFLGDPSVILLDEPISNLEQQAIKVLYEMIKNQNEKSNTLFIITSHMASCIDELIQWEIELYKGSIINNNKLEMI